MSAFLSSLSFSLQHFTGTKVEQEGFLVKNYTRLSFNVMVLVNAVYILIISKQQSPRSVVFELWQVDKALVSDLQMPQIHLMCLNNSLCSLIYFLVFLSSSLIQLYLKLKYFFFFFFSFLISSPSLLCICLTNCRLGECLYNQKPSLFSQKNH